MKHEYNKPVVKLIDYAYQEQVVASSSDEGVRIDGLGTDMCTYNYPGCAVTYSTDLSCIVDVT